MACRTTVLLAALVLTACSSTTPTGTSGSGGGTSTSSATGSGGAGGGTSTTGGGGGGIQCGATPPSFPTFDSSCQIDADCVIKFHQSDCCGTRVAIGVAVSAGAAFDAAEKACMMMYPGCGCAPQATKADDGKTATMESEIKVQCKVGGCSTFIP